MTGCQTCAICQGSAGNLCIPPSSVAGTLGLVKEKPPFSRHQKIFKSYADDDPLATEQGRSPVTGQQPALAQESQPR